MRHVREYAVQAAGYGKIERKAMTSQVFPALPRSVMRKRRAPRTCHAVNARSIVSMTLLSLADTVKIKLSNPPLA